MGTMLPAQQLLLEFLDSMQGQLVRLENWVQAWKTGCRTLGFLADVSGIDSYLA